MLKLIVGLANFECKYSRTRHNIGAWYIKELMRYHHLNTLKNEIKFHGYVGKIYFQDIAVRLLIPTTYMNMSGVSVLSIAKFYHFSLDEILIVHDELDLLPGCVKLKFSGGHNGHHGVKNIIENFGNNNFYRLRIGIGRPKNKNLIAKFVLNQPSLEDKKRIYDVIIKSVYHTSMIIAMNISKFTQCINE